MQNFSTSSESEMELYRYLAAAAAASGGGYGGDGGFGVENDVVGLTDNYGSHFNNNGCYNKSNYSSSCSSFYPGGSVIMNETTETKAIEASRLLHKEAEKRRRERINSHLDRLRSLLPCTSKTDKATLLSKVVQRVLELKRQTSDLLELESIMIPSENDEFGVYIHDDDTYNIDDNNNNIDDDNITNNNNNKVILRASLCCEDRPNLFADLNQVLSSLKVKTLRTEISTLGGRIQGVLILSLDSDCDGNSESNVVCLRDALKGIVQRSGCDDRLKRRRRVFSSGHC